MSPHLTLALHLRPHQPELHIFYEIDQMISIAVTGRCVTLVTIPDDGLRSARSLLFRHRRHYVGRRQKERGLTGTGGIVSLITLERERSAMRILVTSCPSYGHLYPLIPLSWALQNAGHEVLVAQAGRFADVAASTGLMAASIGDVAIQDAFHNASHALYREDVTAALIEHVAKHYTKLAQPTIAPIVSLADEWRPDVVLHTAWEYAGPIVAALLGIPLVRQSWGVALPHELAEAEADALAAVHREWGPAAEPSVFVDVCPPGLQYPDASVGVPMAYTAYNGSSVLPAWLREPRDRRRICVTLGSVPVPGEHQSVLSTVLAGLEDVDTEIVVVTGDSLSIDASPEVRVVDFLPLNQVLPTCDLVVHHGGSGTTMTSFRAGLPQLALPQMCDQFRHAERAAAVGAAVTLTADDVIPNLIRDAVVELLRDDSPRVAAEKIRDEMRSMPLPADVATTLTTHLEER